MGSNIIELAKLGHERAAELKASCGAVDVRSMAQLISDLATQLEVQFVRSTNMAVQLANAESKCRELAGVVAENSTLKSAINFAEPWLPTCDDELLHRIELTKQTPATDAFLAEVRAQAKADGVQEYADSFRHSASKIRECHGDTIRVRALLHESHNAEEFAAKLRQGAKS